MILGIPDSALNLPCFQLIRAVYDAESIGKSQGGRTCFYINERGCTDVTVLKKILKRSSSTASRSFRRGRFVRSFS